MSITCSDIFYFLWGDALFADAEELKNLPVNQSDIEFRRRTVLESLNDEFEGYEQLFGELSKAKSVHSKQMNKAKMLYDKILAVALKSLWQMIQLRRHVPSVTVERIRNECRRNEENSDFSFEKAISESLGNSSLPLDVWADVIYDPNDK